MLEAKVVKVRQEPLCVLLRRFYVWSVCRDIYFGYVHWLTMTMTEEVKREFQQLGKVLSFFDVLNVIRLHFVRLKSQLANSLSRSVI